MNSPAQAILWQIYWRPRWGFAAAAAFLLLAIALVHQLPTQWTIQMKIRPGGDDAVPAVGWVLGVSCLFVNAMLMVPFSMSGSDARDLTFSKHMFVLPVRTSALVAWPMLSGCLTVAAIWVGNACLVFRPGGIDAAIWWPAAVLALVLAAFQALSWTPFVQRWLHGALTVFLLMSPLLIVLAGALVGEFLSIRLSDPVAAGLVAALIPIAYLAACSGIARARRGEPYDWRAWSRFVEWLAPRRSVATHPFRSMGRAQLWYECRAHMVIIVFIGCLMPCVLFVPALERSDVALGWRLLVGLLCVPPMIAMLAGGALGNLTDAFSKADSASFILVRPVSSLSIFKTKLIAAAILTAALWVLFLAYISLLLTRPGFPESIARVASNFPTWKAIAYPILLLALLILFTWETMIGNLWVTLTGRKWVENAMSFGFMGLIAIAVCVGFWIVFHPELQAPALAAVPWLIGLLLLMKLTAAAVAVRRLIISRLTSPGIAGLMITSWLAVVALFCLLAFSLLPAEHAAPQTIVPSIALLIPFARLAGAPRALEWNRHR